MKRILKYQLVNAVIELPKEAVILSVQIQREEAVLWAEVDPLEKGIDRFVVRRITTGAHVSTHAGKYIGTLLFSGGTYVEHLYLQALK